MPKPRQKMPKPRKSTPKIALKQFRPQGYRGAGDAHLPKIHSDLFIILKQIIAPFDDDDPLKFYGTAVDQVAGLLVEFAEDLHNDIGIWRSYEQQNLTWFGTPLPLTLRPGELVDSEAEWWRCRVHHFLWNIAPLFYEDLTLSPTHENLYVLSLPIAGFLQERLADVPRDSGVKKFLNEPVTWGWEVKGKLVWLGTRSYFFRYLFGEYVQRQGGHDDIPTIDDFICQETTFWSGLGVLDLLAAILPITEGQQRDLRSWYERHLAVYQIRSVNLKEGVMEALNLINDRPYTIQGREEMASFKTNMIVQGSLVPWDGYWYWSGVQRVFGKHLPAETLREIKTSYTQQMSGVAYRYCEDLLQKAREIVQSHYDEFLKYHGSDLVLYPDGKTLAKDWQKQFQILREAAIQKAEQEGHPIPAEQRHAPIPDLSADLRQMRHGIGVFFNPDEGQEILEDFNDLISGMEKQGGRLTEDEGLTIRDLLYAEAISPKFVRRVVAQYDAASIAAAFFIPPELAVDGVFLDYLLHKYKGHFYRKRYPAISIVQ